MAGGVGSDDLVKKGKYACPKCGNRVALHVVFTGWEDEKIDPDTGEAYKHIASERTGIHNLEYFCPRYQCDWEGDQEWFDSIEEGEESG